MGFNAILIPAPAAGKVKSPYNPSHVVYERSDHYIKLPGHLPIFCFYSRRTPAIMARINGLIAINGNVITIAVCAVRHTPVSGSMA